MIRYLIHKILNFLIKMVSELEYVPSNKGGLMLYHNEHLYQKLKKPNKDGTQAWRCRNYRIKNENSEKCKALCYTKDNKIVGTTGQHMHAKVNRTATIFLTTKQEIKEKVKTEAGSVQ